jgi:predicted lysophospholipase L1 biosynthesis ABC-type transport system permease subunit
VIDEVFARKYFPHVDPVGKRIDWGDDRGPLEIVGVVGHVKQWGLDSDDQQSLQAQLYEPFRQLRGSPSEVSVVMRVEGAATEAGAALVDSLRRVVQSQHSQNVIFKPQTMNEVIADSLARRRFSMTLLSAFAVVALLLASVGLYGVISYLVGQRTHEIGIRLALGAQRVDVLRLVLSQGMKMALGGVVIGLLAAAGLTRLLAGMLYGVSATDPLTFAAIVLLLVAVALMACFIPARRAMRVDPLTALRYE